MLNRPYELNQIDLLFCGVGCGVLIESDGARIANVRGDRFAIEGSSTRNRFTDNSADGNLQFDALQQSSATNNVFRDNDFGSSSGI